MRRIDRFDIYMKAKGLNDNKVTNQLGLSVGVIGKSRKEGRDLADRNIELILKFYTDLNRVWLLTGEGEMLKPEQHTNNFELNFGGDNSINGNKGMASIDNQSFKIKALEDRIAALEKENDELRKDKTNLQNMINYLMNK